MSHQRPADSRIVKVEGLARVEGEGTLRVEVSDGVVERVELEIFEPPRFFEAFLQGRRHTEVTDIVARICGICPVAYQMSASLAIEDACKVAVTDQITALRRLLYCGEWIQSHALHIHFLHAPDFFGCADAVELAGLDLAAVQRGLDIKKTGNHLMEAVGGRAIHPVNVRVGGFHRAPSPEELNVLVEPLRRARDEALTSLEWVAGFEFPDIEIDYRFVSLRHPDYYAIDSGRIATSDGLDLDAKGIAELVVEEHVSRSTALHARLAGKDVYLTGPLSRYALNSAQLSPLAREAAAAAGLGAVCNNPFRSIIVRAVELVYACEEALRLIEAYEPPNPSYVEVPGTAGVGYGATEAPRGMLFHRYELDEEGLVRTARIVPPTSQNQLSIEDDLRRVAQDNLSLSDEDLTWLCEQTVRNYDPCISCAAHFLDVSVERR